MDVKLKQTARRKWRRNASKQLARAGKWGTKFGWEAWKEKGNMSNILNENQFNKFKLFGLYVKWMVVSVRWGRYTLTKYEENQTKAEKNFVAYKLNK